MNLYYSYLLPLFDIAVDKDKLMIHKLYGVCKGLVCRGRGHTYECIVPRECRIEQFASLLGISKKNYIAQLLNRIGVAEDSLLRGFSLMFSPWDKLYVFTSIYLSRNTNYYLNTIYWVKEFIARNCYDKPSKCRDVSTSYLFRELISNVRNIATIFSSSRGLREELSLLARVKGVGVKSIMAYILHAYGVTLYAPIDRYYMLFLSEIGLKGRRPSIDKCVNSGFNCRVCPYRSECIYGLSYSVFKSLNGVLQSLCYIYYRLKRIIDNKIKPTKLEFILLRFFEYTRFIEEFEYLINMLKDKVRR